MNLKTISTVPLGKVVAFELDSLFEAMYAVKNPLKMYKLDTDLQKNRYDIEVEKNRVFFGKRYLELLEDKDVKKLTRRHIQVIDDNTEKKKLNKNFKHIYKKDKKWYAVVLKEKQKGGDVSKKQVKKDELEEAFVNHILKFHETDVTKIIESLEKPKIVQTWINSFLSKKEENAEHIETYENEMLENAKKMYFDKYGDKYKRKKDKDVYESPHFQNWYKRNVITMKGGTDLSNDQMDCDKYCKELLNAANDQMDCDEPSNAHTISCVLNVNKEWSESLTSSDQNCVCSDEVQSSEQTQDTFNFIKQTKFEDFGIYDVMEYYGALDYSMINYSFFLFEEEKSGVGSEGGSGPGPVSETKISMTQYYYNRTDTILGIQTGNQTRNQTGNQTEYISMVQGFNAVLAICDNIHDFSKYLGKPKIIEDYNDNNEYVHIMNNISFGDYLNLHSFKNLAITNQDDTDYSCISRTYTTSTASEIPSSCEDNQCNSNTKEQQIYTGKWENVFLSKFYYDMLPLKELQFVYKLNIDDESHAENFANFLKKQQYNGFFYDMSICSSPQTGAYYHFDTLRDTIVKNGNNGNNGISRIDTIAKWWDPSSGGEFNNSELELFNSVLKNTVMQPLSGKTSFERILDEQKLLLSDNTINIIPIDLFTIHNCVELINKAENTVEKKTKKRSRCMESDDKLLYYDLKRSGDHGQIMYLKNINQINQINQRNSSEKYFLITGDSMCATKAMFERVPVLFKKFHHTSGQSDPIVDLYFYDPTVGNLTRELLIMKNKDFFESVNNITLQEKATKFYDIKINNNKLNYRLIEHNVQVDINENYQQMTKIINAYEFFVHTVDYKVYFQKLLEDTIQKVNDNNKYEQMYNEEIKQLYENADNLKSQANSNTTVDIRLTNRQRIIQFNDNTKKYNINIYNAQIMAGKNKLKNYKTYLTSLETLRTVVKTIKERYDAYSSIPINTRILQDLNNKLNELKLNYFKQKDIIELTIANLMPEEVLLYDEIMDIWDNIYSPQEMNTLQEAAPQAPQAPPEDTRPSLKNRKNLFKNIFKKVFGKT